MPLTPTVAAMHLEQDKGLSDQWGYNPINHFAIDPRYGKIDDLLAPSWVSKKMKIVDKIDVFMDENDIYQGDNYK